MKTIILLAATGLLAMILFNPFTPAGAQGDHAYTPDDGILTEKPDNLPFLTLAGGCFWCVESEFRRLEGVRYTESGYAGGLTDNPTYEQVTSGETGHAEATNIYYDPEVISAEELLNHFFRLAHDPTQMNRQGVDVGTQYRSAVFYHSDEQKALAEKVIAEVEAEGVWDDPIVTQIEPAEEFWLAEEYHQQYYDKYEEKTGKPHIRVQYKLKTKAK